MLAMSLLKQNAVFAGYTVVRKMSVNHDGEREVYLATDSKGMDAVLTVYNLQSGRYQCSNIGDMHTPDFIEEINICYGRKHSCFPEIVGRGICEFGSGHYAWMASKHAAGRSLADEMRTRGSIPLLDAIAIASKLSAALGELAEITSGGGHYNLRPENIIVDYGNDVLNDVHITGMANAGAPVNGNPPFKDDCLSNLYRAPETMHGIFNRTTDIYSIGMLMLIMLNCDKFSGGNNAGEVSGAEAILGEDSGNHKCMEPSEWNKKVWHDVKEGFPVAPKVVLMKTTHIKPAFRPQSFEEMSSLLASLKRKILSEASGTGPGEPAKATATKGKEIGEAVRPAGNHATAGIMQSSAGKGLDEVAGMSDLKHLLRRNFVDIVKNRQIAATYGITPPNGILLYGAPGCGKTFVAEKAAQESGLKYKMFNPSDFGSIYIHGSQGKIAEAFKEAEMNAPMILIFDEFDAIAPKRDADNNNQANEVNEMLSQLNNCASKGIFVVATTNRPDMIDAACLRTGRMDEKLYVGLPDTAARKEIFAMELKKRPCDNSIDLDLLGDITKNYTCGDISYIVKEAARRCFDEVIRNGDGNTVPLTTEKLMEVANNTTPSVSPADIRRYREMKEKMEHRDKDNKARPCIGFSTKT